MTIDVAIIGMACRFPEANDPFEFMLNLRKGRDSISEIEPDRWDVGDFYAPDRSAPNRAASKWCGQIKGVNEFDHDFFNISPAEAEELDPQQRLLLQETYHCIEDSAIHPRILRDGVTSVHVGAMATDFMLRAGRLDTPTSRYACVGNYPCILSNRLSYVFGFRGPSLTIDAACASSLVAVHEATRQLVIGQCDHAIAAGVSLNLHPWKYIAFSKSHMLSSDGRCKTFDASADGYVPGDGVGVLLLKRLDDALRDRNHIRGIIKGSAVNHGGHGRAMTEPRVAAQRDVIIAAYRDAGISPATVSYVEAHGTGTVLGDPIEVQALTQAFAEFETGRGYCKIGSVKSNIGHLEAAAGVAGLIKVLLMMEQRCIFKTLHVDTPNPIIEFDQTPFVLARAPGEWMPARPGTPLRAGISSFGMGGVNSHVLVEEPPVRTAAPDKRSLDAGPHLFLLSAKSQSSLDRILRSWVEFAGTPQFTGTDFGDACDTLMFGRELHAFRFGVKVADPAELAAVLASARAEEAAAPGPWYLQIGDCSFEGFAPFASLCRSSALFRRELTAVAADIEVSEPELVAEHWAPSERKLHSCIVLHAYLSSLARLDLRLDGVFASGGFLNALLLLKVITPRQACALIRGEAAVTDLSFRRPTAPLWDSSVGRFIRPCTLGEADLTRLFGGLDVPQSLLDSYRDKARLLRSHQVTFAKYLSEWEQAFQSREMDLAGFIENPEAYSRSGAGWLDPSVLAYIVIASALTRLLRRSGLPGESTAADDRPSQIAALLAEGVLTPEALLDLFVKGHASVADLAHGLNEQSDRAGAKGGWQFIRSADPLPDIEDVRGWIDHQVNWSVPPVLPDRARLLRVGNIPDALLANPPVKTILAADPANHIDLLLALWKAGEDLPWSEIFEERLPYRKVSLPTTRFLPKPIRSVPVSIAAADSPAGERVRPPVHLPFVDGQVASDARQPFLKTLYPTDALIRDHVIDGKPLLAAAASLEMIRAAAATFMATPDVAIHGVVWAEPLRVDSPREIAVASEDIEHSSLILRESGNGGGRLVQAQIGTLSSVRAPRRLAHPSRLDFDEACESASASVSPDDIYSFFERRGHSYGPTFRTIERLFRGGRAAVAHIKSALAACESQGLYLDPTLIDGAIQAAIAHSEIDRSRDDSVFMPFEMAEFAVTGPVREECYAYITSVEEEGDASSSIRHFDVTCYDKLGRTSARLCGLAVKEITRLKRNLTTASALAVRGEPFDDHAATISTESFEAFRDQLMRTVETVIGCGEGDVDPNGNIAEYGMDSVSFIDVANALNEKLDLNVGPAIFFEHSTFDKVAGKIWEQHPHLVQTFASGEARGAVRSPSLQLGTPKVEARSAAGDQVSSSAYPRQAAGEPIAIIGMGAILPQSRDLREFWRHLEAGHDLITEIPADRWRWQDYCGASASEPDNVTVKWGGFMPDVDKFDARFFNISARSAAFMDPQQRLFMQTVWKTIEHAGYDPKSLSGTRVAVFVGVAFNDYDELVRARAGPVEAQMATGIANSILSNRVSHFFDFRGPSETIDTACSSSLVALHRAIRALRTGESDLAIAGGVHVMASPTIFVALSKAGMLSPTGRCRAFDHLADGYVRGEGIGALFLKPLSKARRDGDVIHAIILGSATNHGGQTNTLTTPNPRAQSDLIRQSCADAGIAIDTLSYIEAHGTGTPLGDPIEIAALKEAFSESDGHENVRCGIGSVKTNIGHLEAASGIAGVLKVVLAMQHRKLPAHLNFERLSPYISLEGSPFYVVDRYTEWEQCTRRGVPIPRRAGVSSFGFGGTNAHVILEESDPLAYKTIRPIWRLFVLSASDCGRLQEYCRVWLEFIDELLATRDPDHHSALLRDIAYTLQVSRTAMRERLAVVASDFYQLKSDLECYLRAGDSKTLFRSNGSAERNSATLFRGESGDELVKLISGRAEPDKLAALFASGMDFDFKSLQHGDARRIPLPTYPFERERHWIEHAACAFSDNARRRYQPGAGPEQDSNELAPCFIAKWVRSDRSGGRPEAATSRSASTVWISCPTEAVALHAVLESHHQDDHVVAGTSFDTEPGRGARPGIVYFVTERQQSASALPGQEQSVFSLFRLVKALAAFNWADNRCKLVIVTWNAHKCDGDYFCNPYAACVAGFTKGLGKDLPWLDVACIDLDAASSFAALTADKEALLAELSSAVSLRRISCEIAIRHGVRLERTLFPLSLGEPARPLFKTRGTYLLLGGMGNLGFKTARYLARTYCANVVLAGRSELTDGGRRKLEELDALGGRAIYVQADVRNTGDICLAVNDAKTRFGRLDGVVHAAMVYDETQISELSEAGLRRVLEPKVDGSIALHAALAREALDFLLICSSAQVFTATAARCHYTAACAFQDAFAEASAARLSFPTKIINWGFWPMVPARSERPVSVVPGVRSLTESRGLGILGRLDDGPLNRLAVFDVSTEIEELMGVDNRSRFTARACSYPSRIRLAERNFRSLRISPVGVERTPAFDRWIALNVLNVFRRLGVLVSPAKSYSRASLEAAISVSTKYRRLMGCLLDILRDAGFIAFTGNEVHPTAGLQGASIRGDLGMLNTLKRELVDAQPLAQAFIELLDRCFRSYPAVLTGDVPATEVLFPGGTTAHVEAIYQGNPISAADNEAVATLVRDYVEARAGTSERYRGEPLRILEIGAGTGATSAAVLAALQQYGESISYTYSDVSAAFVNAGREKFETKYRFVNYRQIDIEADLGDLGTYDVVIAANVVHATRRLRSTLSQLKSLLHTHGWLVLLEVAEATPFVTATFGLLDGWWRFEDAGERLSNSPLLDAASWQRLLHEVGFASASLAAANETDGRRPILSQSILVAESDGIVREGPLPVVGASAQMASDAGGAVSSSAVIPVPLPNDREQNARERIRQQITTTLARILHVRTIVPTIEFQRLGLDSILGLELTRELSRSSGIELKLTDIFERSTVESLTDYILERVERRSGWDSPRGGSSPTASAQAAEVPRPGPPPPLPAVRHPDESCGEPIGNSFPLSVTQTALWWSYKLAPESCAYNVPVVFKLAEGIDAALLREAWRAVCMRHATLRVVLEQQNENIEQSPIPYREDAFERIDNADGSAIESIVTALSERPFHLEQGPLARMVLVAGPPGHQYLVLVIHHVVCDGVSLASIIEDLGQAYLSLARSEAPALAKSGASYRDFVDWEREMLVSVREEESRAYWQAELSRPLQALDLPCRAPAATPSGKGELFTFEIDAALRQAAERLGAAHGVSVNAVLLGVLFLLLHRHTRQDDVAIGMPVSGRPEPRFGRTVGLFANMTVIRLDISNAESFADLLARIWQKILGAIEHGHYPYPRLLENLRQGDDLVSPRQLFHAGFYFQGELAAAGGGNPLIVERLLQFDQKGEFDLVLDVIPAAGRFVVNFKFNPQLYERDAIARLFSHYTVLLSQVVHRPHLALRQYSLMSAEEARKVIELGRGADVPVSPSETLYGLFEAQARQNPDAVAAVHGGTILTYRELEERADRCARLLRRAGIDAGMTVAVYIEHGPELLIALLGLIKAGAVYVPLDACCPRERLSCMIEDAAAAALLTQRSFDLSWLRYGGKTVFVEDAPETATFLAPARRLASDIAYIIYTSGSTGRPKGVLTPHGGVLNFLHGMIRELGFSRTDRTFWITSICFDPSVLEIYLPLAVGGTIEIPAVECLKDGIALRRLLESSAATVIQATPATYQMLFAAGWGGKPGAKILCGGEAMTPELAAELLKRGDALWNVFGPTEATVWNAAGRIHPGQPITIGRPIQNIQYVALDETLRPVPIGVVGELYISGAGLAAGYQLQDEVTKKSFIPNTFNSTIYARMYKSGDLVRLREDGRFEYLGRTDNQVKLRGYRIELGGVEEALRRNPAIAAATVVVRKDSEGHGHLHAFVKPRLRGPALTTESVNAWLRASLPAYMLPSRVHMLDEIPLTPTRKIDRKLLANAALDEITERYGATAGIHVPKPAEAHDQHVAQQLAYLVATMLNVDCSVVRHDRHLGEYGFDSIRYTGLSALLLSRFGIDVKPTVFYDHNTIRAISSYLKEHHVGRLVRVDDAVTARIEVPPIAADAIALAAPTAVTERREYGNAPVAVIGIAGRFPQSDDVRELWANLVSGRDLITEVPSERWDSSAHYGDPRTEANKTRALWGGFVPHVDKFDAAFFGISPREAELMDPQHRLFLETAWHVIEDAGYRPSELAGTATAVLVGAGSFDYWQLQHQAGQGVDNYTLTGLSHAAIANRVSFLLDLKGPSAAVDTACSSSLVAVHRAVKMIRARECEMAIAGGVSLILSPFLTIAADKAGMMSPAGRCKTFDAAADGYVRGEGVGAVLLKPLAAAERDEDNIYAVIRGSAENHSGRTSSFTAPSSASQAELLACAYTDARLDPSTVTYVEAHGTGTVLGDPIEIEALRKVLGGRQHGIGKDLHHCGIGSIKTNIGHLEVAAGVAGLIKVLLALKRGIIPGILHHAKTNPYIELSDTPLYITTASQPWERASDTRGSVVPRRAGISSFGFGGANAHVVVEEYIAPDRPAAPVETPRVLVLSAKTHATLTKSAERLAQFLASWSAEAQRKIGQELTAVMAGLLACNEAEVEADELWSELRTDAHALARFASRISDRFHIELTAEELLLEAPSFSALVRLLHRSEEQEFLADVAYTLGVGRESFEHRAAIIGHNVDEAARALRALVDDGLTRNPEALVSDARADELLRDWLSGGNTDWRPLYAGAHRRRVSLPGYCFARVRHWIEKAVSDELQRTSTASTSRVAADAAPRCYWRPEWSLRELTPQPSRSSTEPYLVLADGEELANRLRQGGAKVVDVRRGAAFRILQHDTVEIDACCAEGFAELAEYLRTQSFMPRRVIDAFAASGAPGGFDVMLDRVIVSTFRLARALTCLGLRQLDWLHLYERSGGPTDALNWAISGFGRTLRQENRRWVFKCLELAEGHSLGERDDFDRFRHEFDFGADDREVRYAGGRRYVRGLQQVELSRRGACPLRRRGTYLITGGLGAIGRIISRHLAETWDANVILCGRSQPDEVSPYPYILTDVADERQVQSLIAEIKRRFGALDGVFHAAGIIRDGVLERKTDEQLHAVLAAKISGTVNLDLATRDEDLACFVMFSSLAALIGNPGQSDYATANAFMDEFARHRQKLVASGARRGSTVSINFPLWRDGGMRVTGVHAARIEHAVGTLSIDRETGLAMFNEALLAETPQVVAAAGISSRIEPVLKYGWPASVAPVLASASAQNLSSSERIDQPIEHGLAGILRRMAADILKMPPEDIDLNKPMNSYGLDSLGIIDFASRISKHCEIEVVPAIFYENPTIASLAEHLLRAGPDLAEPASQAAVAAPQDVDVAVPVSGIRGTPAAVSEPIAIIGMSCVFPGSPDADAFWNNLAAGHDLTGPYPPERRPSTGESSEELVPGGFMPDVDKFDAAFFDIALEEARLMDPQQRIFLQTAWRAIENAGYKVSDLSGSDTGLFVGVASADYRDVLRDGNVEISEHTASGISHCVLANRISYLMNLHGPSEPVDTGCSSALVAIHRAVTALRRRECAIVVAGGVNVILTSLGNRLFEAAGVISKSGACRPFDARADGYVRGEGAGALVLKRLQDAERDRDTIWAVIRGSAQNHSGYSNGLTAPNPNAQAAVIAKALRDADIDPGAISYIEGHGTGTLLGDSVELKGLMEAFGGPSGASDEFRCYIGSVKGNIGHLEAASGIASVIKVLLAMKHQTLPASMHFSKLNPFVSAQRNPFHVVRETIPWPRRYDEGRPVRLRAGVSSFGFGGTNAHLVLEEHQPPIETRRAILVSQAFVLSAKNSARLRRYAKDFLTFLTQPNVGGAARDEGTFLADMAFTLQVGREDMPARLAVVVADLDQLVSTLRACLDDATPRPAGPFVGEASAISASAESSGAAISCDVTKARQADLCTAAAAWVNGASVDWRSWHDSSRRRIPLPVYPFAETPCWVESAARLRKSRRPIGLPEAHPLLHANLSTQRTARFASVFTADDPLLRDHVIGGQKLMPGVALLEMARAAAAYTTEREVGKLRKIVWQRRLALGDDQAELAVELRIEQGRFEILSAGPATPVFLCASGELEFRTDVGKPRLSERVDLDAVTNRCRASISGDEFYARLAQSGFSYGRSLRTIQSLRSGRNQALAFVEVSDTINGSDSDLLLHPAVLDAALQTIHGISPGSGPHASLLVPFAIAELAISSPVPRRCFIHAEATEANAGVLSPALATWNLAIIAESGELVVKISRYAARTLADRDQMFNGSVKTEDEKSIRVLLTQLHRGELTSRDAISIYRSMLQRKGVEVPKSPGLHLITTPPLASNAHRGAILG